MLERRSSSPRRSPVGRARPFELRMIRPEPRRPYEILVQGASTGVCQTDAHSRDQDLPVPLPAVLAHEGAGFVAAVGSSVTGPQIGDHVTMTFSSCGTCRALLKAAEEAPLSVLLAEI
jgi:aryl-alcohol dehydrogenase